MASYFGNNNNKIITYHLSLCSISQSNLALLLKYDWTSAVAHLAKLGQLTCTPGTHSIVSLWSTIVKGNYEIKTMSVLYVMLLLYTVAYN